MIVIEDYNYVKLRDITDRTSLELNLHSDSEGNSYINLIDNTILSSESIVFINDIYYINLNLFIDTMTII